MATDLSILLRLDGMDAVTSGFNKVSQSMQKFSDKMVTTGKTLSLAVTAPLVAFAAMGVAELSSVQAAMAQTEAVIKSTGGVAGVSSRQIRDLSESLQNKTAVDAEVVQSGANLLLTFTNIKNVAGENNNIFDRATGLSLDLSRALGNDVSSSAVMLGKALNDPIKGITALGKAGVQFTEQQKDQIKTLVESGKTLEAQKMILKELETQVGGSAAAFKDTMGGSLALMKIQIEDTAGALMEALQPAISGILNTVSGWLTWFNSLDDTTKKVIATIGVLVAAIGPLLIILPKVVTAIKLLGTTLTFVMNMNPYILAIGALITAGILLYQNWDKVAYYAKVVWNNVKLTVISAVEIMLDALEHFTGWIPGWGTQISAAAGYVRDMRASIESDMLLMQKPIKDVGDELAKTTKQAESLKTGAVPPVIELTEKTEKLSEASITLGRNMEQRVIPEFFNLADVQRDMAKQKLPQLQSAFVKLDNQGLTPVNKGFKDIGITTSLLSRSYFPEVAESGKDMAKDVVTSQSLMEVAVRGVADAIKGIWNGTTTTFKDVWHGALDTFVDVLAQMVIQAQVTGAAISVTMAAAMAGINLIIGMFAMALGGDKSKIEVVPITTRLKEVFDDFVDRFKSAADIFKGRLFPVESAAIDMRAMVETALKGLGISEQIMQAVPGGKARMWQDEVSRSQWNLVATFNKYLKELGISTVKKRSEDELGSTFNYNYEDPEKFYKMDTIKNRIVQITTLLADNLIGLTDTMLERFSEIKTIVDETVAIYKRQQDFTKDMNKSITDVQRALLTPSEMLDAQLGDVNALRDAVSGATGDSQMALLGELKNAYLTAWGTAQNLFAEDTAKLVEWQKYTVEGLEAVTAAGKTAYDQLIDVNLEMLGIQRDGRDIQIQMNDYLSSLDTTILASLKAIEDIGSSGKASEQQLGYIASAFSQLFDIPKMAHGGIISRPTILMAGEAGPEAIVPLSNPRRAAAVMQDAGLSGGVSITQVFKGPVVLDEISMSKWARKQAKLLNREMLRYA